LPYDRKRIGVVTRTVLVDCDPIGAATDGCGIDVVSLTASGRGLAVALAGGRLDEQLVVGLEGFLSQKRHRRSRERARLMSAAGFSRRGFAGEDR